MGAAVWGFGIAGATNDGDHADTDYQITSAFAAGTSTWTYTLSGSSTPGISHITIGICVNADVEDWDPEAGERGRDPSTGFPSPSSGLIGFKWEGDQEDLIGTYSISLPGFPNDPTGAAAVVKAGTGHEHFDGLDGPDCDPTPTPTDTPAATPPNTPTPTSTNPPPTNTPTSTPTPTGTPPDVVTATPTGTPPDEVVTATPASTVEATAISTPFSEVSPTAQAPAEETSTPVSEVLQLPPTGGGGMSASSSFGLAAILSLGAGALGLGYWRLRLSR